MKKRLRPVRSVELPSTLSSRKLFADEEAIETYFSSRLTALVGCRKLFADEEAIETPMNRSGFGAGTPAGNCSLMKKRLRPTSRNFPYPWKLSAENCSLMKKRLRRNYENQCNEFHVMPETVR